MVRDQDSKEITICGDTDKVEKVKRCLEREVGSPNPSSGSSTGSTMETIVTEQLSFDFPNKLKLIVYQGDLTKEKVDAIVNPANDRLKHSGGAALAIVKAGGKSIQDESDDIMKKRSYRSLQPGEVEITGAGRLPCKFVVHAVGTVWNKHTSRTAMTQLCNAVLNSLDLACRNGAKSISIPAISSGLYGVPLDVCARVLFDAVICFARSDQTIREIRFVNIDSTTNRAFSKEMEKRFPGSIQRGNIEVMLSKDNREEVRRRQMRKQQVTGSATTSTRTSSDFCLTTQEVDSEMSHEETSNKSTGKFSR